MLVHAVVALVLTGTATATTPCEQQVLRDWADNGRIDGVYPLPCYETAIDELPADLRDYTDAAEVIGRALTAALRSAPSPSDERERSLAGAGQAASVDPASRSSALPLPILLLGGIALTATAAAAIGYALRRRHGMPADEPEDGSAA